MSSSNFFNSLTVSEIDSSLIYTCISDVKDELEASITSVQNGFDTSLYIGNTGGRYSVVCDAETTDYNPDVHIETIMLTVGQTGDGFQNGYYGVGSQGGIIGSNSYQQDSDKGWCIGTNSYIQGFTGDTGLRANDNLLIGSFSNIVNSSGVTGGCENNVVLGNNSAVVNGSNNIFIGCNGRMGGSTGSNVQLFGPCEGTVNDGAICWGGSTGAAPSALPRAQFLSYHLTRLCGANVSTQYNPGVTSATPANINGYIRLRYHNYNLLVPVIADADDSTESPAY